MTQLLHLLGQLAAQGVAPQFDRLYRDRSVRRLDLGALQRECGEKPLAPSVWLVNGARARPVKDVSTKPARREEVSKVIPLTPGDEPVSRVEQLAVAPQTTPAAASATVPIVPGAGAAPQVGVPTAQPTPASVSSVSSDPAVAFPASMDGVPQVMAQFQQMMTRFLDTQKSIMLTYLGAGSSAASVDYQPGAVALPAAALPTNLVAEAPMQADQRAALQPTPFRSRIGSRRRIHAGSAPDSIQRTDSGSAALGADSAALVYRERADGLSNGNAGP